MTKAFTAAPVSAEPKEKKPKKEGEEGENGSQVRLACIATMAVSYSLQFGNEVKKKLCSYIRILWQSYQLHYFSVGCYKITKINCQNSTRDRGKEQFDGENVIISITIDILYMVISIEICDCKFLLFEQN